MTIVSVDCEWALTGTACNAVPYTQWSGQQQEGTAIYTLSGSFKPTVVLMSQHRHKCEQPITFGKQYGICIGSMQCRYKIRPFLVAIL